MKKTIQIFIFLMLGSCMLSSAQTDKKATLKREKGKDFSRNSIYIGILGPTIPGSLNYEHIWSKNGVVNIGTKFGGFYSKFPNTNDLTIANGSFECTFIFGRSKHLFEMGIGYGGHYGSYFNETEQKTKHYGIPTSSFTMHYRFQKPSGGFFFHAGFSGNTILLFASSDLKEMVIGNAVIYGFDLLTGEKPSFTLLSLGVGFAFPK